MTGPGALGTRPKPHGRCSATVSIVSAFSIWAGLNADSAASAHVLEKVGMRRFREQDYFKDPWWDGLIYAVPNREWHMQHKPS
jgi:hypothetical protein